MPPVTSGNINLVELSPAERERLAATYRKHGLDLEHLMKQVGLCDCSACKAGERGGGGGGRREKEAWWCVAWTWSISCGAR